MLVTFIFICNYHIEFQEIIQLIEDTTLAVRMWGISLNDADSKIRNILFSIKDMKGGGIIVVANQKIVERTLHLARKLGMVADPFSWIISNLVSSES